jgi:hypothetical protein
MARIADDGRLFVHAFSSPEDMVHNSVAELTDTARDRPAMTAHGNDVYVAFTAPDGSIHVMVDAGRDPLAAFDTLHVFDVGTRPASRPRCVRLRRDPARQARCILPGRAPTQRNRSTRAERPPASAICETAATNGRSRTRRSAVRRSRGSMRTPS